MNAAAPFAPHALVGASLAGRYRLVRHVRDEAQGSVFEGADEEGRALSVKVLRRELVSDDALSRFIRAASAMAAAPNARLVAVLDVGHDLERDLVFVVSPLLRGEDLGALVARVGPLAPDVAVRVMIQAADAVAAAHALDVLHRDVKPSTLVLEARGDGTIDVKLADFAIGSRSIVDGKNVDRRTDVYRLGATLFEVLAGSAPGDGSISIQDRAAWVDPSIAAIIARAMSRDPEQRFPTAEAFASRLRAIAGGDERVDASMLVAMDPRVKQVVAERLEGRPHAFAPTVDSKDAAAPIVVADPLIGHRLGGRYVVKRLLGHGGMGAVYEVEGANGARYAAKVILRDIADQNVALVARFLREGRAVTRIQSVHVTRTIELGTDIVLGVPFIVMELLEGRDLGAVMRERGAIEAVPLLRVFLQAARGLAAAHAEGIIHRDVKPANIFLHASGGRCIAKICDFGLAKATESLGENTSHELTRSGGMLGTPYYMSPEHAQNAKTVDARTDVWSLAASLFEGLTGRKLWSAHGALGELIAAICSQPIPSLSEVAPGIDPAIAKVVDRGLRRELNERFASMAEMIAAIEPLVGGREDVTLEELRGVDPARLGVGAKSPRAQSWAPAARTLGMQETEHAPLAQGSLGSAPAVALGSAPRRKWWGVAAAAGIVAAGSLAAVVGVRRDQTVVQTVDAGSPEFGSAMSANAQAVAAYHAGMQAFRDGAGDMAREKLEKAAEIDPGFAAAHLRRLVLSLVVDGTTRAHATAATQFRSALSDHDRALLDAYLPWTSIPQETSETDRKLAELRAAHPDDADYAYHLCRIRVLTENGANSEEPCNAAIRLDPALVDTLHQKASAQVAAGSIASAMQSYEACFRASRMATSCLLELTQLQLAEGQCGDAVVTARRWIGIEPNSAFAYRSLAYGLHGAGEAPAAVKEALSQAWERMAPEEREIDRRQVLSALETLSGRFEKADDYLREWEALVAKSSTEWSHLLVALWRITLLTEMGRTKDAAMVAADFMQRRSAWSPTPDTDLSILVRAAQLDLGSVSKAQFAKERADWLARERARDGSSAHAPGYAWGIAYRVASIDREDAAHALDAMRDSMPLPDALWRTPDFDEAIANIYVKAGDGGAALPFARRASRSCLVLDTPIESTRAYLQEGLASAMTGDSKVACEAYRAIRSRWGSSPQSVTARAARDAARASHCDEH